MSRTISRVLLGGALVLCVFHLIVYVVFALNLARFPFDYDQGEGFELNDTILLSQGQWPYRSNEVYPFYASNYPPLYHVMLVPFVWLFGPQYWYGRLFGFAATLITAGAIGYAVNRETRHRLVALLAGLAYLASNYIYHIGPLFRQHISMVMFETLAIVALAVSAPRPSSEAGAPAGEDQRWNRGFLLLGLALLLAAGFTKQLAIATAAGFFIFLFLRSPRRAILCGVGLGAVAGALFVVIDVSTQGQWWLNIITANVNEYFIGQLWGLALQFVSLHGALLILAGLYALYELYLSRLSVYSVWFVASLGSAVLSGKWGAGDSYFATMIAAICVLAGLFAARAVQDEWPLIPSYLTVALARIDRRWLRWLGPLAAGAFLLYGLAVVKMPLDLPGFKQLADVLHLQSNTTYPNFYDSARWTVGYAKLGQLPTAQDVANGERIAQYAAAQPGTPIMSEEAAFSFRANKPVVTNPTQLLNLFNNGHLDPQALVQMIRDKKFSTIIFRARFYPKPVLDAVDEAYQIVETIPMNDYEYQILTPR